MIGKLEELVLLACLRAGREAFPSAIYERLLLGHADAAFGAVYTTLVRLAKKGLLDEGARADEGGRSRRVFTITRSGRSAVLKAISASARVGGYVLGGQIGGS